jgi:hypothetical protein
VVTALNDNFAAFKHQMPYEDHTVFDQFHSLRQIKCIRKLNTLERLADIASLLHLAHLSKNGL